MQTNPIKSYAWSQDRSQWTLPLVLRARAATHAEKTYLIEGDGERRSFTFGETFRLSSALADGLAARGLEAGQRLAIMMENRAEFIFAWFGANLRGIIEAPLDPSFTGDHLRHVMRLVEPVAVVTTAALVESFIEIRASLPDGLSFFLLGDDGEVTSAAGRLDAVGWGAEAFTALLEGAGSDDDITVQPGATGAIMMTSGTTGQPKGVVMPFAQMHLLGESVITYCGLNEDDVIDLWWPLFHSGGQMICAYSTLILGATVVVFSGFDPATFFDRVREHSLTVAILVGQMMDLLLKQPPRPDDADNTLRAVSQIPARDSIHEEFRRRFGVDVIGTAGGSTEITFPFMAPVGSTDRPAGSSGLLVDDCFEVSIVDPHTDLPVSAGEAGELLVRSKAPWLMSQGYWRMPEKAVEATRNLWFHTGDAYRRDDNGWFFFVDRISDALGGQPQQLSTADVEEVLLRHPAVVECAVVAAPNDEAKLLAILSVGQPIELSEIASWASAQIDQGAAPQYWRLVDSMPKTPTGKIKKNVLRASSQGATLYDSRSSTNASE